MKDEMISDEEFFSRELDRTTERLRELQSLRPVTPLLTSQMRGLIRFNSRGYRLPPARFWTLNEFHGDIFDLGDGSWYIVGTAKGQTNDPRPVEFPFSAEFTAGVNRFKLDISGSSGVYEPTSNAESPVQVNGDPSVPRVIFRVTRQWQITYINIFASSYLSITV